MRQACVHATAITAVHGPRDVCESCIEIGSTWVHLRQCLTCGRTLCCDNSPNRHMTGHFNAVGHPVMRGADPGEQWTWCFVDSSMIRETDDGWEQYDPYLETGVLVAGQEVAAGRSLDVAEDHVTPQGFPLGEWVAYVREAHGDGSLLEDDAALVEAIPGWAW
ncbi:MAG TPA: UBP-type zinc finger domain-containing protein [Candidatus Limnocylindrales bacterium]